MTTTKSGASGKPRTTRKAMQFQLVTNHQNMLYMLAAGMAMGPAGFRGKHYADSLSAYPGFIPLFRDRVPAEALSQATSEHKHLLPCIASFDLSDISGSIRLLQRDGRMRAAASLPARKGKNESAILIRAPLPLTLLSGIHFRSLEDKQAFESAAKNVSNVEPSSYPIEVARALFLGTDETWPVPQAQGQLLEADNPPAFGQALGGVLAMLYQAASRSDLGLAIFRLATGSATHKDLELTNTEPILAELPNWLNGAQIQGDVPVRLFWGSVEALVNAQIGGRPSQAVSTFSYLDGVTR